MNVKFNVQRPAVPHPPRQVDNEVFLRLFLLVFALALPLAAISYLKIQQTRLSYQMSELHGQIRQEEELQRILLLERSHLQRSEAIQAFADQNGMVPRKQS